MLPDSKNPINSILWEKHYVLYTNPMGCATMSYPSMHEIHLHAVVLTAIKAAYNQRQLLHFILFAIKGSYQE